MPENQFVHFDSALRPRRQLLMQPIISTVNKQEKTVKFKLR